MIHLARLLRPAGPQLAMCASLALGSAASAQGKVRPIDQISQGLMGYISMNVETTPEGFGQGVSYYTGVWPLLASPLASFQIGLPSIWILPDNRGFDEPLCPIGSIPRDQWPERGPSYRDVFQTIEGGLGFWGSTQFGSPVAKYRMNGTPNCYTHEISSPGFGFGNPVALSAEQMGLAQLCNRLVVPPDGLTFVPGTFGELFGTAWMALPLMEKQAAGVGSPAPDGDQCWTLFVNAVNFRGPVAFWTPRTWTRIADNYPTAAGRGLDTRPGLVGGGAMEINTVPMFVATDAKGRRYSRIPRLQFPVDREGNTVMMQDFTLYSAEALGVPTKTWLAGGSEVPSRFGGQTALVPKCTTGPISVRQGPSNILLTGIDTTVETTMLGPSTFGLKWKTAMGTGFFPEYFRADGQKIVALPADKVPDDSGLKQQTFTPATKGTSYSSPERPGSVWTTPGPKGEPITLALSDGSTLTYKWYRFVDQPSIRALNLSDGQRSRLQSAVERLQREWTPKREYMPGPSRGKLATLDAALMVTPPAGLEIGYVPIATRQNSR